MPLFPSSSNPNSTETSTATATATTSSPSFFSWSFFGSDGHQSTQTPAQTPQIQTGSPPSANNVSRTRSLSRTKYTRPSITADEAMNLARATSFSGSPPSSSSLSANGMHRRSQSISEETAIDDDDVFSSSAPPRNNYKYGKYDGGSLSRVVSAEPDFAAPSQSNKNSHNSISSSQIHASSTTKHSSALDSLKKQVPAANTAQLHSKLTSAFRNGSPTSHSAQTFPDMPLSSSPSSLRASKFRRNSNSKYQGIGLVAAYDQGGIL